MSANFITRSTLNEPERIWTSVELMDIYSSKSGLESNITRLMERIMTELREEIYFFKSSRIATLIRKSVNDVLYTALKGRRRYS